MAAVLQVQLVAGICSDRLGYPFIPNTLSQG